MVKFKHLATIICAVLSIPTYANPNIKYAVNTAQTGISFDHVTWNLSPQIVTAADPVGLFSYFWSNQLTTINGGHAIYFGPGIHPNNKRLMRFGVFGTGTSAISTGCVNGIDGGAGTTCESVPWEVGHDYQFEINYTPAAVGSSLATVEAIMTDLGSGQKTSVGQVAIPSSWGAFSKSGYMFDEFRGFNSAQYALQANRPCVPYAIHTVSLPVFYSNGVALQTQETALVLDGGGDKCSLAAGTYNASITQTSPTTYLIKNGILSGSPGAPQ